MSVPAHPRPRILHIVLVGDRNACLGTAADFEGRAHPDAVLDVDAATMPFRWPTTAGAAGSHPRIVRIPDLHLAFPNQQTAGTRLVLTQATYLLQKWVDTLDQGDVIVATADPDALRQNSPEAFDGRGVWRSFDLRPVEPQSGAPAALDDVPERRTPASAIEDGLARAYASTSAADREALCRAAVATAPDSPVAALALGSACREVQDPAGARAAFDTALRLAPRWEAAHYEDAKFWLACEDLERARDGFRRAAELMPTFSAALSNLGATLGELDDQEGAAAAFHQALAGDPDSFTILNNIGIVNRERGELAASEAALRRVVELAPGFVFGHYNLGHTLFLQGNVEGALAAYQEGQRRDPEKNRRQGVRLAMVRFASGDVTTAERDLWHHVAAAPPAEREDLLLEAYEVAHAAVTLRPGLGAHREILDKIAAEVARTTT